MSSTSEESSGGELRAWHTAAEFSADEDGEVREEPPMLPGEISRVLSNSVTATEEAEDENTAAVVEQVLELRREVQEVEALVLAEAIELEWLRGHPRARPRGSRATSAAKSPSRRREGAEQRRRRLALQTRARLDSEPRPIVERGSAVVVPEAGDGPRLNKAAALRQQRSTEARKSPAARRKLPTSDEWDDISPRYLKSASTSRLARSPARPSRQAVGSSSQLTDTTAITLDVSLPRLNRTAELRQQHRERNDATPSHEESLKEAAIRARKAYLKPPPGLDLVAPSPRSAQLVDTIFKTMDTHKVRVVDLVAQLGLHGSVSAKELKAAFCHHGVKLSDTGVQTLVRLVDMDGNGEIDVKDFIEQMRKLRGARRKMPGDLEVTVSPQLVRRINSCGVESRKLAAVRLKLKAHSYSAQDPTKVFQQFGRVTTGSLELSEFTAAVRKVGKVTARELTDDELQKLFESFDVDGQQKVATDDLMGFIFGSFDLIEEKSVSGVRLSQDSPVRTPQQARRQAKTVAEELRMQRLGASPSHWAVEVISAGDTVRTKRPAPATTARRDRQQEALPVGSGMLVADRDATTEELHAAARRIQAAARGMFARQPPSLPYESDSYDDGIPSDDGTPPRRTAAERAISAVTENQQTMSLEASPPLAESAHQSSEPVVKQPSVSAVVSHTDAEIGYERVLQIAEEARRLSPRWNPVSTVTHLNQHTAEYKAAQARRWDQSPGWSPAPRHPEVQSMLAEGLPPSSVQIKVKRKEPTKPMTHREWKQKQAESRASAKAREAARRQHLATNVSFEEAVERVRSCLSCQLRSSVVDTVSSLLRVDAQRAIADKRKGRYISVTQIEHLLRSWVRDWQSATHDGKPLHGFDYSMVRLLSHHLVKSCHEDQTRLEGYGFTGEFAREAAEADEAGVMIQYVDILQFIEALHGPQSKATLTKVLAMVDPERFSPTTRQAQAVTASPQVPASAGHVREKESSDEDGSAEAEIRPFGLKAGWDVGVSRTTKKQYYINSLTNETQYEWPTETARKTAIRNARMRGELVSRIEQPTRGEDDADFESASRSRGNLGASPEARSSFRH